MPSTNQAVMLSGRAQTAPVEDFWTLNAPGVSTNLNNAILPELCPGTQDWCWETWINIGVWANSPALIVGWGSGGNAGNPGLSNWSLTISGDGQVPTPVEFRVYLMGSQSTAVKTYNYNTEIVNQWMHVAMSRIGGTVNVFVNGELAAQMTGVTADLTSTNIAGDNWWVSGGPVGDRDEGYSWGVGCSLRNMRWTVGNSVYADAATITVPSLYDNITPVTGTVFIWWPASNTYAGYLAGWANYTWTPDYCPSGIFFTGYSGDTGTFIPDVIPVSYPIQQMYPNFGGPVTGTQGTWVNQGTSPNQPVIGSGDIPPILGSTYGDFTATGSNVNITSSDCDLFATINNSGNTWYIWFYVPGSITNECKNLINCEVAGGMTLNIGRPGQGLDWLSIYNYEGTELGYGQHIWARDQWNYLVVGRFYNGYTPASGGDGSFVAWAGSVTDNYAQNIGFTNTGAEHYDFASGNITIGSKTGSSVSCEMYLGQIQCYSALAYDYSATQVPIQNIDTRLSQSKLAFTFQGTAGDANIQPGGF